MKKFFLILAIMLLIPLTVSAVPMKMAFSGYVQVDGEPYTGNGSVKIIITDEAAQSTIWSNDGSGSEGTEPDASVPVTVDAGYFTVLLGDTTLENMTELTLPIFADTDSLYLKLWFDDGTHGFQELSPMMQLSSSPFAINCQALQGYGPADFFLVSQNHVTTDMITDSAVTDSKIGGYISSSRISGLDTMALQPATNVNISGGSITGITDMALADGGTGASLTASNGGIVYSGATGLAILGQTATSGQVLLSGSNAAPTWSTPTYPNSSGTAGKVLISDGTNFTASTATYPATTTANQILYSSGANTVTGLPTANGGVLVTDATGVPSITTNLQPSYIDRIAVTLLGSGTVANAKIIASTTIHTVPTGKSLIIQRIVVRCTEATDITGAATASFGGNLTDFNDYKTGALLTGLTLTTVAFSPAPPNTLQVYAAGTAIKINITTGAIGTSQALVVDVFGYHF